MSLSVVVCTLGRGSYGPAVASVLLDAAAAGIDAEVILVWQAREAPPAQPDGVRAIHVMPAGLSYARNRGAAAARSARLAFVDDDEVVAPGWAAGVLGDPCRR